MRASSEPRRDDLINGALRGEHRNAGGGAGREPEPVNPVQALEEAASGEVAVHVDGIVALVVQADSLPERRGVGQQDHAVRVLAEPLDLFVPVRSAAVHHRGVELREHRCRVLRLRMKVDQTRVFRPCAAFSRTIARTSWYFGDIS